MLSVEEALNCMLDSVSQVGSELIPLTAALGRVLAVDVAAPADLPRFSHATVDGFAIHSQDAEQASKGKRIPLKVIETVPAGSSCRGAVKPGVTIRVMTGAPLPPGAGAVVRDEDTSPGGKNAALVLLEKPVGPMENVARAGESVRRGDLVLRKGTTLRPGNIGVLASLGFRELKVFRRPEIAVLSTGSELVDLGEGLSLGKIFASSFYVLLAKLRECGCTPVPLGVVGDEQDRIRERIRSGLVADGIITTGGTGHGGSDWVRPAYREMAVGRRVDGVAMSPGRSFVFGLLEGRPVFALPGSPSASIVTFEELVKPVLLKMGGKRRDQGPNGRTVKIDLGGRVRGRNGVQRYVLSRIVVEDGRLTAVPIAGEPRGSLGAVTYANGMIVLPAGESEVLPGQKVWARLFGLDI
ncbi:MAG: molybdopterin molybdotransferase MoeA [Deltaproteobacteria bacterium]|nr:molybdopterin molybdotransferase MoeA [Deltaproteobacteria bacterium]